MDDRKFSAEYFDEDFYVSKTGVKGFHRRDQNCPNFIEFARRIKEAFKDTDCRSILDIGAGTGIRTTNHIQNGFDAYPYDVSKYGYDNSVLPNRHYLSDIRNLSSVHRTFDIVIAERVLGYIPPEDSEKAVSACFEKAKKYLVFSIICEDHPDKQGVVEVARPGRINIQMSSFWEDIFKKFKMTLDEEKTKIMLETKVGVRHGIWIFKKGE